MNFEDVVSTIRERVECARDVPKFDPENGNETAKLLFLLEAPGPKALKSRKISLGNKDKTAENFRRQLAKAEIEKEDIAIWNVVPWYLGNKSKTKIRRAKASDVQEALDYLKQIVKKMDDLQCIILVGEKARAAHVALSAITGKRIFACHHFSPQAMNTNSAAEKENIAVLKNIKRIIAEDGA